jgi:16S rRNA (uracil1498-N3)-methyltransferase
VRAIYYSSVIDDSTKSIVLEGEAFKHLMVVRVKLGEAVMVLNGEGISASTKVITIAKNQIELKVESFIQSTPSHDISLAIANPKKEAFEDILKMAVELGVMNIHPLSSAFSQYDFSPSDRIQRVLESALTQSNNPFFPKIHTQESLDNFLDKIATPLYFFNSKDNQNGKVEKTSGPRTILIGPEGGFSASEEVRIMNLPNAFSIHLPTPILRAPTAVASSIGYLLYGL